MSTENSSSNQIFATGGISNLAYWENRNRISCSKPRKTQKFLLGDCETNTNLPETVTCVMMQGCKQTDGSVCMDQTLSNIIRMASQANKLTYPSDFMKILQISIKLLKIYNDTTADGSSSSVDYQNNVQMMVDTPNTVNLLLSTMSVISGWPRAFGKLVNIMNQFINDEIASDKQNMYSLITDLIHLLLSSKFKEVWSNLINDRKISYNQLLTNLNQILLYMSTFNTPDQVSQCHVLIKSINTDVASYSLNFKINNNCSINTTNSVTLNIYQTNYAQDTRYSQFKFTPNPVNVQRINNSKQGQQQNLSIIGGLSVLTILDENLQDSKKPNAC
ncbi:unnamed protein product [Heterobilharzia americana]|nr:unnamed protein product [Heterobilharzia americana]